MRSSKKNRTFLCTMQHTIHYAQMTSNMSLMKSQLLSPPWKRQGGPAWQPSRGNDARGMQSRRVQSKFGLRKHIVRNGVSEVRVTKLETDVENMAKAILALQEQQNSYLQVIDAKVTTPLGNSLTQEIASVECRLKQEIASVERGLKQQLRDQQQEYTLKLLELRACVITIVTAISVDIVSACV